MSKYSYHKDGTLPSTSQDDNICFVFGSNLRGAHGAGAAAIAATVYNFPYGFGWGYQWAGVGGGAYAIPTKNKYIQTLPLDEIEVYVDDFVLFTLQNDSLKFFVTGVGCGLAGYSAKDIAHLFIGAKNCSFPENWKEYLES